MPSYATAFAREKITVSSTAVQLTEATFTGTSENSETRVSAKEAFISVEDSGIRFTLDGTTPVDATDVGHVVAAGATFNIYGLANIRNFRAVRVGGTDAVINVTYFRG